MLSILDVNVLLSSSPMFPFPQVFFLYSVTSFFLLECLLFLFVFIELASIMAKF
jgi:hypothetical protein